VLEVRYSFTPDDARDLYLAHRKRARRRPAAVAGFAGAALVLASGLFLGLLVSPGWLCLAVPAALIVLGFWRAYVRGLGDDAEEHRRWVPPDNGFTTRATPEQLVVTSALSQSTYRWTGFSAQESYETPRLFVLAGVDASLVIPKRAFKSDAELDAFRDLVSRQVLRSSL
jgi:hypothetical protein